MTGDEGAKRYWNRAARDNAAWYIATGFTSENEAFFASGASEVDHYLAMAGVELLPGSYLVEIGCGTGRMTRHLVTLASKVIALDISGEMLARARENLAGVQNVDFIEVSGSGELPLPDNSANAVFSYITMQHVPTAALQKRYVTEALRVTAPGGWVLMQFRRGGAVPRILDWIGHVRHLVAGRRTVSRAWRGSRVSERELLSLANATVTVEILHTSRRHIWALARVS